MNKCDNIAWKEINLADDFWNFVSDNASTDPVKLRLKFTGKTDIPFDVDFAITQIESRRKTARKLPRFTASPRTLFPTVVSAEQASDELVASFHAGLIGGCASVADLTAGLGIDAMCNAANRPDRIVTAVEIDPLKCRCLRHNASALGIGNLRVMESDCLEWLREAPRHDTLFIDPARRGENNRRTYAFSDCVPDIIGSLPLIMSRCDTLLVKASPLLDISAILKELPRVDHIHAVGAHGECKELLISIKDGAKFDGVTTVELFDDGRVFTLDSEYPADPQRCVAMTGDEPEVGFFVHEPTATMMKTACWPAVTDRWPELRKISANTHLFISESVAGEFPGRIWRIKSVVGKRELKKLKGERLSVVSRNHPLTAPRIREEYRLREGDGEFLIACRWGQRETPVILQATRHISD